MSDHFQMRVEAWLLVCFGAKIAKDRLERGDRLLEEVLELLQSTGFPRERIGALADYVYSRPIGEPRQELGGVMVTLAAFCFAYQMKMQEAGEVELSRILQPEIIEKIRAKQAAKPTGSALPIATEYQRLPEESAFGPQGAFRTGGASQAGSPYKVGAIGPEHIIPHSRRR